MKRAAVVGVVLIAAFVTTGGSAWAGSAVKLCVPKAQERDVLTPKHGKCNRGYKLTLLGAEGKEGKEAKSERKAGRDPKGRRDPEENQDRKGK